MPPPVAAVDTGTPIGSVVAFAGPPASIPNNWLVCDGRKLNTGAFAELFQKIGTTWGGNGAPDFYIPDLRGQFLRGVDKAQDGAETNPPRDMGRGSRNGFAPPDSPNNIGNAGNDVGSFQSGSTARPGTEFTTDNSGDHTHGDPTWNGGPGPFEVATLYRGPGGIDYGAQSAPTTAAGGHTHKITGGGDPETRPINAYVYWIIRVR